MRRWKPLAWCFFAWCFLAKANAQEPEFRALWVDAWHSGFRNPGQVARLLADARLGNFNALIVQVRKRADAYYDGGLEPKASEIASSYDPLADLIARAHSGDEPLEVHAWMNTYIAWTSEGTSPPEPNHVLNAHPDWLNESVDGVQWNGQNFQLDPGHPEVQQHVFDVAMDIVRRYDVDGIHLDYVRYPEQDSAANANIWGYNPVSVARYNALNDRTGKPPRTRRTWQNFRRDQVTALVRKIYLNVLAEKPHVRVSAALIPWGAAPTGSTESQWQQTAAYSLVLQDWRAWLEEGILDLGIPMVYRSHPTSGSAFRQWNSVVKRWQYDRAVAIGTGFYLNDPASSIEQIEIARLASRGESAVGIAGFSYAVPTSGGSSRSVVLGALSDPLKAENFTGEAFAPFAQPVATPPMPWKQDPAIGHLMGQIVSDDGNVDGVSIELATDAGARQLLSDATGFFGAVDLVPGTYELTAGTVRTSLVVSGGEVARVTVPQQSQELASGEISLTEAGAVLTWASLPAGSFVLERSADLQSWESVGTVEAAPAGTATIREVAREAGGVFYRLRR